MITLKQAYKNLDSCLAIVKKMESALALRKSAPNLFGRPLPNSIIVLIFEFDNTKREALNRCLNQFSKGCYDARCPARKYISRYHKQAGLKQERMADWVDRHYSGHWWESSSGCEIVMDGRYIKSVYPNSALPVISKYLQNTLFHSAGRRKDYWERCGEFKIAPGDDRWIYDTYTCTYYSDTRDWRSTGTGVHAIDEYTRIKRTELGLPIYTDKARYQMAVCKGNRVPLVSNIHKNIKKWEQKNPELCNY
tara:strand:+ start:2365 stop:3114 length:750 start_codon:yes stop_codon:yes gene_type:complete